MSSRNKVPVQQLLLSPVAITGASSHQDSSLNGDSCLLVLSIMHNSLLMYRPLLGRQSLTSHVQHAVTADTLLLTP